MSEAESQQNDKKKQPRSTSAKSHPFFTFAAPTDTSPTFSLGATPASESKPLVFGKDSVDDTSAVSGDSGKTKSAPQKNTKVAKARRSKYDKYAGGSADASSPPQNAPSKLKTDSAGDTKTIAFGVESADASGYTFSPGSSTGSGASRGSPSTRRQKKTRARGRGHKIAAPRCHTQPRSNVPGLPPELWAHILDYSDYDTVARMARVSRAFLHETMPLLKSLYFVNNKAFSTEANQASRFRNGRVEDIVIDCLFEIAPDEKESRTNFSYVDSRKPSAFIHFVATLPSIKNVFFGAGKKESKAAILDRLQLDLDPVSGKYVFRQRREAPALFIKPRQDEMLSAHAALFRSLIRSYRYGRLSQDVRIYGLPSPETISVYDYTRTYSTDDEREHMYNSICECFPLDQVRPVLLDESMQCCEYFPSAPFRTRVKLDVALRMILQRPGGKDMLASADPRCLLSIVRCFNVHVIRWGAIPGYDGEPTLEPKGIGYLEEYLRSLEILAPIIDPSGITREEILDAYSKNEYISEQGAPYMIRESVYRLLTKLGFALDTSAFLVVPDKDFTGAISL